MYNMYQRYLKLDLEPGESAFLWGARKTGKSTYLSFTYPDSARIDFLNGFKYLEYTKAPWKLREDILNLPPAFLKHPIIIDEVQKVPTVMDEIHLMIETYKLSFILCGSSTRKMRAPGVNLLGGRALKYHFYPLVYPEIKDDFDLLRIFNNGLIPQHYPSNKARRYILSYINDYLINEVHAESLVQDLPTFTRFFDAVGFSHGEMINYANIARDAGVSAITVKAHYQILVETLVGYLVEPYSKSIGRDIISSIPKFYFFDVGIATKLSKTIITATEGAAAGRVLEHYIFLELYAYTKLNMLDHKISYWRTHSGIEVDFVAHLKQGLPVPIEVKISSHIHKTELKNLKIFMKEYGVKTGYIVCMETTAKRIILEDGSEIITYPVREFLENLWSGKILKEQE